MASRARQLSKLLSSDLLTVDVNNSRIGVNSTSPEETLDVRDSLTVGFDTSTTDRDLHIYSTQAAPVRIETTANRSNIDFKDSNTTSSFNVEVGSRGNNLYLEGRDNIEFITNTNQERMRITGVGGSVGIGTTIPSNRLHIMGSHTQPQIKIQDSEDGDHAQISLDGVNDTLNFDWVSGVKRDIHFLNTGYTTAGGQGGIAVGVGTTNGRRIAGFTINADGGNANSHTAFAVKAYQNNNFLRFAREGTSADGSVTVSNNYDRTGGSEYTPDNVNIDRTSITFHRSNGILLRHSTQDGSATYSSAPTIRLTVDENGIDVNGSISKDSGSFRIPHPLAGLSTTNDLVHSFVEAPDASNLYAGMVDLVDGTATVNIDTAHRMTEGTFVALNHVQSWSSSNESGYSPVKCSISGNLLTIECQDTSSTDTVYYEVRGIRKDQHMIDTDWTDDNGRVITEPPKRVIPE